jgi:hypothetical protein
MPKEARRIISSPEVGTELAQADESHTKKFES